LKGGNYWNIDSNDWGETILYTVFVYGFDRAGCWLGATVGSYCHQVIQAVCCPDVPMQPPDGA